MIQSVKCLLRKILNSDSQNPHKNWPDTAPLAVSALGRQRPMDPGIHWPTSIAKQWAPGSVRIEQKRRTPEGKLWCLCAHALPPPQMCTHSRELVHMNTTPPHTEAEREVKAWVRALYTEVNGAGFSPFIFMWLLRLKLRLPGLCGTPFAYWATLPALFLSWKSLTRWFRPAINSGYSGLSPIVLGFQACHQVQ